MDRAVTIHNFRHPQTISSVNKVGGLQYKDSQWERCEIETGMKVF